MKPFTAIPHSRKTVIANALHTPQNQIFSHVPSAKWFDFTGYKTNWRLTKRNNMADMQFFVFICSLLICFEILFLKKRGFELVHVMIDPHQLPPLEGVAPHTTICCFRFNFFVFDDVTSNCCYAL